MYDFLKIYGVSFVAVAALYAILLVVDEQSTNLPEHNGTGTVTFHKP